MNNSFAKFQPSYPKGDVLDCTYVDRENNVLVDDYRCSDGSQTPLLSSILTQDNSNPRDLPPNGKGWKHLVAPRHFKCTWDAADPNVRIAETFDCSYKHRDHPGGPEHRHYFTLDWMIFATQEDPTRQAAWYAPHHMMW